MKDDIGDVSADSEDELRRRQRKLIKALAFFKD